MNSTLSKNFLEISSSLTPFGLSPIPLVCKFSDSSQALEILLEMSSVLGPNFQTFVPVQVIYIYLAS